ncbi:MAG: ABC transporter ATP-binding protein/permease [Bacilli bacterium]|nr:ABC transporter ATP-binding protein/permease [Bacilli bacterium]
MFRLFRYLKNIWWLILIAVTAIGTECYLGVSLPNLMSRIAAIMQHPEGYFESWKGLWPVFGYELIEPTRNVLTDTWIIGGIMLGHAFVAILIAVGASLAVSFIGAHFGRNLRHAVYAKTSHFSVEQFTKFGTASLITRTTNDIEQCQQMVQMGLRTMVRAPITLILSIVMILTRDTRVALILAVSIPAIILVIVILFIKAVPLFEKMQTLFDKVTMVLRESLTGVRVVRAFNQQKREKDRFNAVSLETEKTVVRFARIMSFGEPIINIVFNLTYIGIYFFAYNAYNGVAWLDVMRNFPGILASAEYAMELMSAFLMFSFLLIMWPRASVSAKRINAVLDEGTPISEPKNPLPASRGDGLIEFENVTFAFPDADAPSLMDVSFTARPGKTTAIIGSTGSGKSSLIHLIPRLYDVTEGSVRIDGHDVREYATKDLRSKIGFVPQQALLFKGTIRSNMLFGAPNATDEDIVQALSVAQASHFIAQREEGIDSIVEQGGKNFSGGQKQRLCIARALVRKAEIYVFDDSFSALDFRTDTKLRHALKDYISDATILIVAQRVSTILDADNIVVLNEGRVVGQGRHAELMKTCPVYQEIVHSQLDSEEIKKTLLLGKKIVTEGGAS